MKTLLDVVNFNADASCLSVASWLEMLNGGERSTLVSWLRLYPELGKKVVLGFTGATVADISIHNPQAITLINSRPDIFEIILRPFAHDIALLRSAEGFAVNFTYGRLALEREFDEVTPWYLPPEFMLTNGQLARLAKDKVAGIFINPARFSSELRRRIPDFPYHVRGVLGSELPCIPVQGLCTDAYLHALHTFDCGDWNRHITGATGGAIFSWRDGESPFFLPDALQRERNWLEGEDDAVTRMHLRELNLAFVANAELDERFYRSYPVHSFTAWLKEFRMLGFVGRINRIEQHLERLDKRKLFLWLAVINSDIMSAIEKKSPVVRIVGQRMNEPLRDYLILRSERGFEGEEYLEILENELRGMPLDHIETTSGSSHLFKLQARLEFLSLLD